MRPAAVRGSCRPPEYPVALREAGTSGRVVVSFIIGADGRVEATSMAVVFATDEGFVPPTLETIRSCRFQPGQLNGVPVRVRVQMPINFSVERSG